LVYAPGMAVPFHWLSLVPLAILRSFTALLGKNPGAIGAELAAAFVAAFSGISTGAALRRLARSRTLGWGVIAPLRVTPAEMRRPRSRRGRSRLPRC
ncbi:hypothetical protein ACC691_38140, partial [Rhizobium johnstonii]|uniref:hypothetical protein n=1 Tax=Rhizobium johnstonii TaxID=3019933 RepID=UPI003F9B9128